MPLALHHRRRLKGWVACRTLVHSWTLAQPGLVRGHTVPHSCRHHSVHSGRAGETAMSTSSTATTAQVSSSLDHGNGRNPCRIDQGDHRRIGLATGCRSTETTPDRRAEGLLTGSRNQPSRKCAWGMACMHAKSQTHPAVSGNNPLLRPPGTVCTGRTDCSICIVCQFNRHNAT